MHGNAVEVVAAMVMSDLARISGLQYWMDQRHSLPFHIVLLEQWTFDDWIHPAVQPTTTSDSPGQQAPQPRHGLHTVPKSPAVFGTCRPYSLLSVNWSNSSTLEDLLAEDRNSAGRPWLLLHRGWSVPRDDDLDCVIFNGRWTVLLQ